MLLVAGVVRGQAEDVSQEAASCLVCHDNRDFAVRMSDGEVRSMFVDPSRFYNSSHAGIGCGGCHGTVGSGPHGPVQEPELTATQAKILAGRRPIQQVAIAACMGCHAVESAQFADSIHATSAMANPPAISRSATIATPRTTSTQPTIWRARSARNMWRDLRRLPRRCDHDGASRRPDRCGTTFETSFHGAKGQLGQEGAAVCTSCHGVHEIRAPGDPKSRVNPANVAEACGQPNCHPGATERFAEAFTHELPERPYAVVIDVLASLRGGDLRHHLAHGSAGAVGLQRRRSARKGH